MIFLVTSVFLCLLILIQIFLSILVLDIPIVIEFTNSTAN